MAVFDLKMVMNKFLNFLDFPRVILFDPANNLLSLFWR